MVAPIGRLVVPQTWRAIRSAFEKTVRSIRQKVTQSSIGAQTQQLQPAYIRNVAARQPIHRAAAIRQTQSRWYTTRGAFKTTIRRFTTGQNGVKTPGSAFPASRTAAAVSQLTSRAPFASTLRPNLTGGTLSRTAGGYGTGAGRAGARYFSHSPAAPAEVVNNVSAAMRAFWLSGQRIQYNGSDRQTGMMKYKSVDRAEHETRRRMQNMLSNAPGSYVDFKISPMVTAIGSLGAMSDDTSNTLNHDGLLETLSGDFARAFKDLSIITNDLKKLASVGDLTLTHPEVNVLRVRFPGVDADTVERLCDELGIQRGTVNEDPDFSSYHGADMALLFPFAPSRAASDIVMSDKSRPAGRRHEELTWQEMLSPTQALSPGFSNMSATSHDFEQVDANPWLSSPSGYSSLHDSENDVGYLFEPATEKARPAQSNYDDFDGIYRFLEECERARR